eukprot:5316258-Pyramimonas_sp.AAC.1
MPSSLPLRPPVAQRAGGISQPSAGAAAAAAAACGAADVVAASAGAAAGAVEGLLGLFRRASINRWGVLYVDPFPGALKIAS